MCTYSDENENDKVFRVIAYDGYARLYEVFIDIEDGCFTVHDYLLGEIRQIKLEQSKSKAE